MFDFQSPSFFTRSPCSTILYVCVCLHCWVTQKGKPFRISIIKICIWGCVYPPTLETCCKYNHIIISAKSWSNSNNSFFNNVQQNLSSFQDYYVWFSCFPNTSGWFWCHEFTHGCFLQTFGTTTSQVSKRFQGVGPIWGRPMGFSQFVFTSPPKKCWIRKH